MIKLIYWTGTGNRAKYIAEGIVESKKEIEIKEVAHANEQDLAICIQYGKLLVG